MRYFTCCLFVIGIWITGCKEKEQTPISPPQVQVVVLNQQEVIIEKDFVGQVYGYRDIPIRARVEGYLEKLNFQEGSFVKQGTKLYSIFPDQLREGVVKAKSELANAQILVEKANNDFERISPLAKINAVSQKDLDAAVADKGAAEALLEASKANLRLAEIRLGYATVISPINGVIGKSLAKEGEFVGRSPNPVILNTISSIDSIRVEFFLTESDYLNFVNSKKQNTTNEMPLKLLLADGKVFPEKGRLDFVNREVDAATGAILISAIFPNPKRLVRPGQFARVRMAVRTLPNALLVPQRCVKEIQGNFNVMRVNGSGQLEQVTIVRGPAYRDYYIVNDGLKPGDKVVFEGLQKAAKGSTVEAIEVKFTSQSPESGDGSN